MGAGKTTGFDDLHALQVFLHLVRSSQLSVNLFFEQFLLMVPAEPDNKERNRNRDKYTQCEPPIEKGKQDTGQGYGNSVCDQWRDRAAEQRLHTTAICHHISGQFRKILCIEEVHRKFPKMLCNSQPSSV